MSVYESMQIYYVGRIDGMWWIYVYKNSRRNTALEEWWNASKTIDSCLERLLNLSWQFVSFFPILIFNRRDWRLLIKKYDIRIPVNELNMN